MAPAAAPAAAPAGAPAAAAAVAAAPPPAAAPAPVGLVVEMEQWKGTDVSNDTLARRLTLKSANGDVHTFTVHHDVANLNSVKAGDNVTVDFVESVAIEVKGAKAPVTTGGSRTTQTLSPKGHNTIYDVAVMQVDVKVTSINHATRQMTVVTSSGSKHTIRVDPSVTAFSQVKVGDQIIVRATEAVAMTITKH
jgi:hypothetical protein